MDADLLALLRAVEAAGYRAWNRNYGMQCPKCQHSRRHHKKARPPAFVRSSTISRVARRDNCRRLDHEDDAFFGCPPRDGRQAPNIKLSAPVPRATLSVVVMFVVRVPVAVVDRDDRVIVTVVEVFRGRRLVIVAVAVNGAHETAGLCRIADPAVARQLRIGGRRGVRSPVRRLPRDTQ